MIAVGISDGATSGHAPDVGGLVGVGRVGGEPVAQHEVGGLRTRQGWNRRDDNRRQRNRVKPLCDDTHVAAAN